MSIPPIVLTSSGVTEPRLQRSRQVKVVLLSLICVPPGAAPAVLLVCAAITAAYVTSLKPGDILFLVGAAFSLAASAFFPPLVMGVFWKRANKWGAIIGMAAGLGICIYYMLRTYPFFTNMGVPKMDLWFGLSPVSAGMFGLPVGLSMFSRVTRMQSRASSVKLGQLHTRAATPQSICSSSRANCDSRKMLPLPSRDSSRRRPHHSSNSKLSL